ncbi:MAG: hypothetical protein ACRESK_02010, partial [Gammaproteobacteria bacterium]
CMVAAVAIAQDDVPDTVKEGKRSLTQEEIDHSIGRFGETETVPEGFQYSEAENLLWREDHLRNIDRPMRLYYTFNRSGSHEEGFTDAVYLDVVKINDDGTRDAVLDFFTAARQQKVSPENVTNIKGNPVMGVYMQGDVYEMNRLTEGHWRYFQKRIKIALREVARVDDVEFDFNGKLCKGEKIVIAPYLDDPHRADFEKFANKRYEFILSDDVPGSLYQIHTIVPDAGSKDENKQPLIEETLTLMEAKSAN